MCPYCATRAPGHQFLSEAQLRYVRHYCEVLSNALEYGDDGEVVIDMDVVADAVREEGEKPTFYVSEQSQQCKFTCHACGEFFAGHLFYIYLALCFLYRGRSCRIL